MNTFERSVLSEARTILQNSRLRLADLMEWSTSEEKVRRGSNAETEVVIGIPGHGVWCAVKKTHDKRKS